MKTFIVLTLFFVVVWNIASYFVPEKQIKVNSEVKIEQSIQQGLLPKIRPKYTFFTPYNICVIVGAVVFVIYITKTGLVKEPIHHHFDHEEEHWPNYVVKYRNIDKVP